MKILVNLFLLTQIVTFCNYNKNHLLNWINEDTITKNERVNDKIILIITICYLMISTSFINSMSFEYNILNYFYLLLILSMTILSILFYVTNFETFNNKIIAKTKSKKDFIVRKKFLIRKITEIELAALINEFYRDSFSSDFQTFKRIFINSDFKGEKLVCIDKTQKSKRIGYVKIFELIDELSEYGILDLWEEERAEFKLFVINNFKRGDEKINNSNLDSAYTKWLGKNR